MASWLESEETLTQKGQIAMPYAWSVGEVGSRFLLGLRDEKRIFGNRCDRCGVVYVPPRKNCGVCFHDLPDDGWREVGPEGIVTSWTIVCVDSPLAPAKAPFAYVIVKLDGADVGFVHLVRDDLEKLAVGVRVAARFREAREGNILDIDSFVIV